MAVLVTAFTPFGGSAENTSQKVLDLLPNSVDKLLLPTSYERSFEALRPRLDKGGYSAVVLTGEASRENITVERIAVNVADARIPDNDGVELHGEPLVENGPDGIFSTLPINEMAACSGAEISNTAGTFVCNVLMYKALYHVGGAVRCGFVHLPKGKEPEKLAASLMKMLEIL